MRGKPKFTAEVIYKFITGDVDFEERHTGLEDVKIEKEIFLYCLSRKPEIDGRLWKPEPKPSPKKEDWEIERISKVRNGDIKKKLVFRIVNIRSIKL